jgi:hypothetical protein
MGSDDAAGAPRRGGIEPSPQRGGMGVQSFAALVKGLVKVKEKAGF